MNEEEKKGRIKIYKLKVENVIQIIINFLRIEQVSPQHNLNPIFPHHISANQSCIDL